MIRPSFLAVALLLPAAPAGAATLDLSWDNCAPLIATRSAIPGPLNTIALYASATNLERTHVAHDVSLWFANALPCAGGPLATPDAWRFDAAGCQWGFATVGVTNPQASCPPLSGPTRTVTLDLDHAPADGVTPAGAMRLRVRVDYAGSPQGPDAYARRHVFAIAFDHTFSSAGASTPATCGGLEQAMCFSLRPGGGCGAPLLEHARYTDTTGSSVPFTAGQASAAFALDPAAAAPCFAAVPVRDATWGAIKGQYR
jgi:hypothetical protein